jgi:hypothetical protein
MTNKKDLLSKSNFQKGVQCKKALWYLKHRKDLKPNIDEITEHRFEEGNKIGELAQSLYPGGVLMDLDYYQVEESHKKTLDLINQGSKIIYEATAFDKISNLVAKIDIAFKKDDAFELIEVKSSTSKKPEHITDLAFQYYVFKKVGHNISACKLMYMNKEYVRVGNINPKELFVIKDVTNEVLELQGEINSLVNDFKNTISSNEEPIVKIGSQCSAPHECDYKSYCWKDVPEYSILNLFSAKKAWEIIDKIGSFNIEDLSKDNLPKKEKGIDYACYINQKNHFDNNKIIEFVDSLKYPLYFLDYETVSSAIPLFEQSSPYQQIPFQFSIHKKLTKESGIEHVDYLHLEKSDPRPPLIENLIKECGSTGSIIVYYESFEKSRNKELADFMPEYKDEILSINTRIVDLYVPFKRRWAYSPKQNGSASIKAVLPALTDINYDHLDIRKGDLASLTYLNFLNGKISIDSNSKVKRSLKEYCKLDTFAMVEIYNLLLEGT